MIGCAYLIARMVLNIMLPLIFGLRCEGHFRLCCAAELGLRLRAERARPPRLIDGARRRDGGHGFYERRWVRVRALLCLHLPGQDRVPRIHVSLVLGSLVFA